MVMFTAFYDINFAAHFNIFCIGSLSCTFPDVLFISADSSINLAITFLRKYAEKLLELFHEITEM